MSRQDPPDSFAQRVRAGDFAVSLEITPPRTPGPEVLLRRATLLGDAVDAVDVIERPERVSSLDAAAELRREGIEAVWHCVNRGRTRAEIAASVSRARDAGLPHVLCIRGDHRTPDARDTPKLCDVVGMFRAAIPDGLVGVTANQYGPPDRVLANLLPKLREGADYVQTQPVFDEEPYARLAEAVKSEVPHARLWPTLMPLGSISAADRLQKRLGFALSAPFRARLDRGGESAGWDAFRENLHALVESPLVDGVALMTLAIDPEPDFARSLRALVAAARTRGG
jgi:5,10-methylenetetrahydrofolate reductase